MADRTGTLEEERLRNCEKVGASTEGETENYYGYEDAQRRIQCLKGDRNIILLQINRLKTELLGLGNDNTNIKNRIIILNDNKSKAELELREAEHHVYVAANEENTKKNMCKEEFLNVKLSILKESFESKCQYFEDMKSDLEGNEIAISTNLKETSELNAQWAKTKKEKIPSKWKKKRKLTAGEEEKRSKKIIALVEDANKRISNSIYDEALNDHEKRKEEMEREMSARSDTIEN